MEASWWQRITARINPPAADVQARLADQIRELSRAIARNPQSAATYNSRGEVYMNSGDIDAAMRDFRQALALAEAQFRTETWGIVAQAVRDRALEGLKQAQEFSRADDAGK